MLKKLLFITICFLSISVSAQTTEVSKTPLNIGEVVTLKSKILSEERVLNIYLPQGYKAQDTLKYPVLYVLDGTMNEDFLHIVGLTQFFNLQYTMPETIVVGIANVDRKRDFTFQTTDKELKAKYPTTGASTKFIMFLESEVQPYIQKNYQVNDTKMLIGQSLGGLLATEVLLKRTELFTHYFIVSPSLWWDNESMLKDAKAYFSAQKDIPLYVYVSVGTEGEVMESEATKLSEMLKRSGKKKLKTDFKFLKDENHASILHQSLTEGFKLLWPLKSYD
ncbi:alpha/beta hydrolase-fold protein [Subsaxibacter sp. CAU 1640]|uniref:alpha/beta hydrolase n=1 Tax=Subsaxibacter sp. CAU 1640 TaxID=2933271 RepID=UPI002006BE28|nr:alpha/beta hydrolase-fold protein [Subsaxibacter sp. CAU 1640]MCK7591458.1 alpha/beta hydrolase-fold protein [Subsaxibacter sp. CAU 1640]